MRLLDHKLRRSSVDWEDFVPPEIARRQMRWERITTARAMVKAGLRKSDIARVYGVSRQLIGVWMILDIGKIPPVEIYISRDETSPVKAYRYRKILEDVDFNIKRRTPKSDRDWLIL